MVQRVAKVMHNNLLKGRGMRDFSKEKILDKFSVDIELTNACNASCSFCPRDKMPDIGTIKPYHFYKAVERGLEHPGTPYFAFCGSCCMAVAVAVPMACNLDQEVSTKVLDL